MIESGPPELGAWGLNHWPTGKSPPQLFKKVCLQLMLERVWRKGIPLTLLVGMQTGIATVKNSMEIP